MSRLINFFLIALCLFAFASATGRSADLSPYLDSETIAVVRVNLKRVDIPGIHKYVEATFKKAVDEALPPNDPFKSRMVNDFTMGSVPTINAAQTFYRDLVIECKVEEIYVIVYRDAITKQIFPVLLAIPVPEGATQEQIDTIRMQYLNMQIPVTFVRHGFIVGIPIIPEQFASQQKVMAFAREKFKEPSVQFRPEIVTALDSQPGALLQVVIGRIDQFQKDVEMPLNAARMFLMGMPREEREQLEQALKMVPIIFQSLKSYSFSYDYGKPEIRQTIQLKDEQTAKTLQAMGLEMMKKGEEQLDQFPVVKSVLEINAQNPGITPEGKVASKALLKAIQIKQQGNDVVMLLDSSGMAKLETLIYEMGFKHAIAGMHTAYKFAEEFYRSR